MSALSDSHRSLSLFVEALAGAPRIVRVCGNDEPVWPWGPRVDESGDVALPVTLQHDARRGYRALSLMQLLARPIPGDADQRFGRPLEQQVYSLLEARRVRAVVEQHFPGATGDVARLLTGESPLQPVVPALAPLVGYCIRSDSNRAAHEPRIGEGPELLDAEVEFDTVLRSHVEAIATSTASTADVLGATARICDALAYPRLWSSGPDTDEPLAEQQDTATSTDATRGVSLDGGEPTALQDQPGGGAGQLLSDLDLDDLSFSAETDAAPEPEAEAFRGAGWASPPTRRRSFVYDEWDYHEQRHRPAWCTVTEERLVGDDYGYLAEVRERHGQLRSEIRRSFERLRPQQLRRVHRHIDGEELDIDAAIEAIIDRRSGAPVDERMQVRRERLERDVATAFLIDLSASTSAPATPPEPEPAPPDTDPMDDPLSYGPIWDKPPEREPVRRVIDVAKEAVTLMGDALHDLGDQFAIYGFSGTGRQGSEFKVGKDFGDRVSARTWASVAAMKPLRYTRMGPAIRHAAFKLRSQTAQTRLLIVLSDGYPQDTDYGRDRNDRDYGLHDTARALTDATQAGIDTFCVTIDPAGHDYLRDMCPDQRYLVIDDVESLPEHLADLYLHMT